MPLILKRAVTDFAEPIEEHGSRQRVPGLALVESGGDPPSQLWIFEPSQHEKGSFNPSDLAQSKGNWRVEDRIPTSSTSSTSKTTIWSGTSRTPFCASWSSFYSNCGQASPLLRGKSASSSTGKTFISICCSLTAISNGWSALELKQGSFRADYQGQMELYLRWLAKYERFEGEPPPLGIILCARASNKQIELLELDAASIHGAEYLTELPSREVFERKLHDAIAAARLRFENKEPDGGAS